MRALRFILFLLKPYQKYVFGVFFSITLIALDGVLRPFLIKKLIDIASHTNHDSFWLILGLYILWQCTLSLSWIFFDYCGLHYTGKIRIDTADHFVKRLYDYPYTFFQNNISGALLSKVQDAFQLIYPSVDTFICQFYYFGLLVLFGIVMLARVDIVLSIMLIIWICVVCLFSVLAMNYGKPVLQAYAASKSKIMGYIADYFSNIFSVKIFAAKHREWIGLSKVNKEFGKAFDAQADFFLKFYSVQSCLASAYSIGLVIFLITGHLADKNITPGDFAFVVMLNFNIISNVFMTLQKAKTFVADLKSIDQAVKLLENVDGVHDIDTASDLIVDINTADIEFKSVSFSYPNSAAIFEDLSVHIRAGEKVGLVGYSGGGKSTFVNLIMRLYDVNSGTIFINEQDISIVSQDSLRNEIAMIPQDTSMFHRSVMENIAYSQDGATEDDVISAAKQAHAHDFIMRLPQGYDSLIGERGVKLSGGQRQRIAIARAILKKSSILIMDEATSQLDSLTEHAIQNSLTELMSGKTTIVIAHRLSTLLNMDRIIVFDKGKIVEDGSHASLLEKQGVYYTLWNSQIGGFIQDHS